MSFYKESDLVFLNPNAMHHIFHLEPRYADLVPYVPLPVALAEINRLKAKIESLAPCQDGVGKFYHKPFEDNGVADLSDKITEEDIARRKL